MSDVRKPDGADSEPPKAVSIVIACVVGVLVVGGILLLINLLS